MGMYTGIRFKGFVKKEFRNKFKKIALNGEWEESEDNKFKEFGKISRSSFIPCGSLSYMPDEWETDYFNKDGKRVPMFKVDIGKKEEDVMFWEQRATDGFERTYDENTGYWTFQCSLKNYEGEIEQFFELIPYFIESIEHLEYFYEEMTYSRKYELIDGEIKLTNTKFSKYGFDEDDYN